MEREKIAEQLLEKVTKTDRRLVEDHIASLGNDYFNYFTIDTVIEHLACISRLDDEKPVFFISEQTADGEVSCTVIGHDYPAVFSLITGILSSNGLQINTGKIFTYRKKQAGAAAHGKTKYSRRTIKSLIKKRIIIDHFAGYINENDGNVFSSVWEKQVEELLVTVFSLIRSDDEKSHNKARAIVNNRVSTALINSDLNKQVFYPVRIEIDNSGSESSIMRVYSENTPFFLYTLATTLSLHNVLIEQVNIKTVENRILDELVIVNSSGKPINDPAVIDILKLSVLLTKQFTHFLGSAPDPYSALSRFEYLISEITKLSGRENWVELLSNPHLLKDLARLLGASDFLWEDFIRTQYEMILPMLQHKWDVNRQYENIQTFSMRLDRELKQAPTYEDKQAIINNFKDREIFNIDLDHILNPETDFRKFSYYLTLLAETIIDRVTQIVYRELVKQYGVPRTVAGLEARYSVLGLGKMGGAALGYASDIELLFVYSDNGKTDGNDPIENSLFFDYMVKNIIAGIKAKKEGIFDLDLRLRPYGKKGPLACSLDLFSRYYNKNGSAHSYERLALVRMRPVAGDRGLGGQLERLRDQVIYFSDSIDLNELRDLRNRQLHQKNALNRINAKFTPGALVDIEYSVQILQVMYGHEYQPLITPRIHDALDALAELGILDQEERVRLVDAYDFFRKLINGLRVLRGSARDLYLPDHMSQEYIHLARRMGYDEKEGLSAAQQLYIEFQTRTAVVRVFVEKHFGSDSLPAKSKGNVSDIILSESIEPGAAGDILEQYGFKDIKKALVNFGSLAGEGPTREVFSQLAVLAADYLANTANPDMGLNNWERYVDTITDVTGHYANLLKQPKKLEIMLRIFSISQYLSEILFRNPEFLEWALDSKTLYMKLDKGHIIRELKEAYKTTKDHREWLNALRLIKKKQFLRIGVRDVILSVKLEVITRELSLLAEAIIEVTALISMQILLAGSHPEVSMPGNVPFAIMAFGKLGGNELNYSSDVDLLMIHAPGNGIASALPDKQFYVRIMEMVLSDLSSHTEEGHVYRVDLRLRPYGAIGALAYTIEELIEYYKNKASLWEIQALLKIRPVAGNIDIGKAFILNIREICINRNKPHEIINSIKQMRNKAVETKSRRKFYTTDIKNGIGGIRDIEFLVQGLQLIYLNKSILLFEGNTLLSVAQLKKNGLLHQDDAEQISEDYIFMRRIEHFLQLYENLQTSTLPDNTTEREAVAKRMLGARTSVDAFLELVTECMKRTREYYNRLLIERDIT